MDFKTRNYNRNLIHSIARNSNWNSGGIKNKLNQSGVYSHQSDWQKFLYISLLSLGACFTVTGIIFFLAFNWTGLHKFVKLSLVQGVIISCIGLISISRIDQKIKDIVLLWASLLVGALFAVFGQIYQTGANAYDFFLGWTVFIALWVIVSKFPPLWLLFISLINITFWLYTKQVSSAFSNIDPYNILFVFNSLVIIGMKWFHYKGKLSILPNWFIRLIALASISYITFSLCYSIAINDLVQEQAIPSLLAVVAFSLALRDAFKTKDVFYLCIVPLSVIIVISSIIIQMVGHGSEIFLLIAIFIIGSISLQISQIIKLNKKWNGIK